MRFLIKIFGVLSVAGLLQACAAVDQFGGRIEDANRNSQRANDQETLLNIIRAKFYRPLTFVAVSQITGGQTETLTTGLPTITFGSGITAAQHIGQITNSVMSQAQGGYQSNVLLSTAFQTGMLAPISGNHDCLSYRLASARPCLIFDHRCAPPKDAVWRFVPLGEQSGLGRAKSGLQRAIDRRLVRRLPRAALRKMQILAVRARRQRSPAERSSSAEIIPQSAKPSSQGTKKSGDQGGKPATKGAANASTKEDAGSGSDDKPSGALQGRFCFDPTKSVRGLQEPRCSIFSGQQKKASAVRYYIKGIGMVEVEIFKKSPLGVYQLLGALLRHSPEASTFPYTTNEGTLMKADNKPFIEIVNSLGPCFTEVSYGGEHYCVPPESYNTTALFDIVEQLKNLSTTPSDLNVPFSVRFSGN